MAIKLFDDWNVQLAKTYEPGIIKPNEWFSISQKINGTRATYFAGSMISRSAHKIEGLSDIIADIESLQKHFAARIVLDGELRLHDEFCRGLTDNEAFKIGTGIANSTKDMSQKYKLQFVIFDIMSLEDWAFEFCQFKYSQRLEALETAKSFIERDNLSKLRVVPRLYSGIDQDMIETCLIEANRNGWEGIMINRDERYQFKRTNAILKYKSFNTIDLECIGMLEGTGKYEGTLGALCCKFGDNIVNVGTGFTDAQRSFIWNRGSWIKGKIIEVKYKDVTSDAITGLASLQFPVFVCIKSDKIVADTLEALRRPNIIDPNK